MDIENIKKSINENNNSIIGEDTEYTKYAVVIPLIKIDNKINLLFEVRSKKMRSQPGEISFPGGRMEYGESSIDSAIRETCEELGIDKKDIEILGPADMLITQHYKIIYTFAAKIEASSDFKISIDEVDHVFFVPLDFFINTKPIIKSIKIITEPEEELPFGNMDELKQYKWITGRNKVYFYKYENYVIWGITAKIIDNFIKIINDGKTGSNGSENKK